MATFRPGTPEQAAFLDDLLDAGLLIESGVPGVYGRGAAFEDVRVGVDALVDRGGRGRRRRDACASRRSCPRRQLEASGYLKSFPHLAGTIFAFDGDEAEAHEQVETRRRHEDWSEFQAMTDLVLHARRPATRSTRRSRPAGRWRPAACSSTPAAPTSSATSRRATRRGCRCSTSARSSGSASPRRSSPGATTWRDRALALLRGRRARRPLRRRHRIRSSAAAAGCWPRASASRRSSSRSSCQIAGPRADRGRVVQLPPGPLRRRRTGSSSPDGETAHTACLGFGLERITLALLRRPRARRRRLAGRGREPSSGSDERRPDRDGQPVRPRPGDLRAAPRCTAGDRAYPETNCYSDILIELLHARGDEPLAVMGFTVRDRLRGRPVDVLQAATRGPGALFGRRHPRDAAVPPAARADRRADRGAGGR